MVDNVVLGSNIVLSENNNINNVLTDGADTMKV